MTVDVGSAAPDFTLKSQHGEDISLASFRRSSNVVLVFIPFAFSGTCTSELREIRDQLDAFTAHDARVLAISCDHVFSNRAFSDSEDLTFPVLSDFWPHGAVSTAYGTFNGEAGAPERGSYVIDREGIVRWKVRVGIGDRRDLSDVLAALAEVS